MKRVVFARSGACVTPDHFMTSLRHLASKNITNARSKGGRFVFVTEMNRVKKDFPLVNKHSKKRFKKIQKDPRATARFHLHHIEPEALTDEVKNFEPYRNERALLVCISTLSLYVAEKG